MIRSPNQIDKRMSSGGPEEPRLDMNKFIELADAEKIEADALNELFEAIQEKFKKLVKKLHPDMNAGNKKFEDKLKIITLAYTQLKNTYKERNES